MSVSDVKKAETTLVTAAQLKLHSYTTFRAQFLKTDYADHWFLTNKPGEGVKFLHFEDPKNFFSDEESDVQVFQLSNIVPLLNDEVMNIAGAAKMGFDNMFRNHCHLLRCEPSRKLPEGTLVFCPYSDDSELKESQLFGGLHWPVVVTTFKIEDGEKKQKVQDWFRNFIQNLKTAVEEKTIRRRSVPTSLVEQEQIMQISRAELKTKISNFSDHSWFLSIEKGIPTFIGTDFVGHKDSIIFEVKNVVERLNALCTVMGFDVKVFIKYPYKGIHNRGLSMFNPVGGDDGLNKIPDKEYISKKITWPTIVTRICLVQHETELQKLIKDYFKDIKKQVLEMHRLKQSLKEQSTVNTPSGGAAVEHASVDTVRNYQTARKPQIK